MISAAKSMPFSMQKACFRTVKGHLLQHKQPYNGKQKTSRRHTTGVNHGISTHYTKRSFFAIFTAKPRCSGEHRCSESVKRTANGKIILHITSSRSITTGALPACALTPERHGRRQHQSVFCMPCGRFRLTRQTVCPYFLLFMPRIVLIFKQIAYLCKAKR